MAPKARRGGVWVAAGGGMPLVLLLSSSGEGIDEFCEDLARRMQLPPLSHPQNVSLSQSNAGMLACMSGRTYVRMYVGMHACERTYACVCGCVRVCMRACTYVPMYSRTHVFVRVLACARHIPTCAHARVPWPAVAAELLSGGIIAVLGDDRGM